MNCTVKCNSDQVSAERLYSRWEQEKPGTAVRNPERARIVQATDGELNGWLLSDNFLTFFLALSTTFSRLNVLFSLFVTSVVILTRINFCNRAWIFPALNVILSNEFAFIIGLDRPDSFLSEINGLFHGPGISWKVSLRACQWSVPISGSGLTKNIQSLLKNFVRKFDWPIDCFIAA